MLGFDCPFCKSWFWFAFGFTNFFLFLGVMLFHVVEIHDSCFFSLFFLFVPLMNHPKVWSVGNVVETMASESNGDCLSLNNVWKYVVCSRQVHPSGLCSRQVHLPGLREFTRKLSWSVSLNLKLKVWIFFIKICFAYFPW